MLDKHEHVVKKIFRSVRACVSDLLVGFFSWGFRFCRSPSSWLAHVFWIDDSRIFFPE